jgi:hypothetical protein
VCACLSYYKYVLRVFLAHAARPSAHSTPSNFPAPRAAVGAFHTF